jgi:hypothetical protein
VNFMYVLPYWFGTDVSSEPGWCCLCESDLDNFGSLDVWWMCIY